MPGRDHERWSCSVTLVRLLFCEGDVVVTTGSGSVPLGSRVDLVDDRVDPAKVCGLVVDRDDRPTVGLSRSRRVAALRKLAMSLVKDWGARDKEL